MIAPADIIIVGAGSAGAVLASRLSERSDLNILLLEADERHFASPEDKEPESNRGRARARDSGISLCSKSPSNSDPATSPQTCDVQTRNDSEEGCTNQDYHAQSVCLPDPQSIDAWSRLGNEGWTWSDLHPYYQKVQEAISDAMEQQACDKADDPFSSKSARTRALFQVSSTELKRVWDRTFANVSQGSHSKLLSKGMISAETEVEPSTYLTEEVRSRANLRIVTGAHVEKLLLTSQSPARIQSIRYATADGKVQYSSAASEIILCAGALNTPQILELSGIGASDMLRQHQIRVIVDLPGVGENLQDHVDFGVSYQTDISLPGQSTKSLYSRGDVESPHIGFIKYSHSMGDILGTDRNENGASLNHCESLSAVSQGLQEQHDIIRSMAEDPSCSFIQHGLTISQPLLESSFGNGQSSSSNYLTLTASAMHPFSRGSCHIASSDLSQEPVIDPKYFTHPKDAELKVRQLQKLERIAATSPLADLLKSNTSTASATPKSRNDMNARALTQTGFTMHDLCGSCSMMSRDYGGVVDPSLHVYGVEGLRICDASILPLIPRGNIQKTVFAVAERAADMIKNNLRARHVNDNE